MAKYVVICEDATADAVAADMVSGLAKGHVER